METKNIGLRGIEVADTKVSNIDGEKGKLIYRGYDILDLTKNSTYEETAYLLLHDNLPTKQQLDEFKTKLKEARFIPKQMQINMGNWRKDADPMDMLQAFVSALAGYYDEEFSSKESSYDKAINLISKTATIIASWNRIRNDLEIIDPDPSLDHAGNFLYMMFGQKPDPEIERIFDVCLILHAEHTFNASTFIARQVASTRAHMYSAASAAIGALSGELHGGANYEVMRMLLDIGQLEKVEPWIKEKMEKGERIMGMGHAVYKTYDPRAQVLKELSRKLAEKTGDPWYKITEKVETTTISEMKKLIPVKQAELKELREAQYKIQNGKCAILDIPIKEDECVFDHKHKLKSESCGGPDGLGCLRGVIHHNVNVFEGKLERLWKRYIQYPKFVLLALGQWLELISFSEDG